jgi:hypothetical protein
MSLHSYFTSITAFFMGYVDIPDSLFRTKGIMTQSGIQACAKYLIDNGVFADEEDMKTEAFKSLRIIIPDWVFDYKRSDTDV